MPLWTDYGHGFVKVKTARADHPHAAFLCCPGPSLAEVGDLRGPGRTVYAINTAYPKIRPDAWIGLDRMACFDAALWHEAFPKITRYFKDDNGRMRHQPGVFYADLEDAPPSQIFTRRDGDSKFIWQRNTLLFAVHFLVWSGHKRIHFIGCDMGGARDYWDARELTAEQRANNRRLYDDQVETLRRLAPLARRNGVELVSSTPDSPLNHFLPCQSVAEAIAAAEPRGIARPIQHVFDADRSTARHVVLVLKRGGDFRPEHVERLARQLAGCTITLLTDYPARYFPELHVVPLRYDWPGWWSKMEMFGPWLLPSQAFLYLDLDTTVRALPETFFTPAQSVVLNPFTREEAESRGGVQTGVMFLHPRERAAVWNRWAEDPERWMREHRGDQDFVHSCGLEWARWEELFPGAVVSYKQNLRAGRSYAGGAVDEAAIRIVAYHGKPRPWEEEGGE